MRKHPTQGISCVTQTLHQALFSASLSCLESPCVILHWEGGAETYRMTEYIRRAFVTILLFQISMLPLSRIVRLASLPTIQQASLPTLQQAQLLSTASGHKASVDSRWLSLFLSRSFLTLLIRHPIDSVTRGLPSFLSAKY